MNIPSARLMLRLAVLSSCMEHRADTLPLVPESF